MFPFGSGTYRYLKHHDRFCSCTRKMQRVCDCSYQGCRGARRENPRWDRCTAQWRTPSESRSRCVRSKTRVQQPARCVRGPSYSQCFFRYPDFRFRFHLSLPYRLFSTANNTAATQRYSGGVLRAIQWIYHGLEGLELRMPVQNKITRKTVCSLIYCFFYIFCN